MDAKYTVYIDPSIKVLYASFYIQGLFEYYGKRNVKFSGKPFQTLKKRKDNELYDHFMAYVVVDGKKHTRFIIDFWDKTTIDENAYDWCNCYAKINTRTEDISRKDKLLPIPPGFGIKIWNRAETIWYCLNNFLKSKRNPAIKFDRHYEDYFDQFERPELKTYEQNESDYPKGNTKPYVFMIGRLWPHKNCVTTTNPLRRKFIQTCRKLNLDFEGGLFAKSDHPNFEDYKEVIFTKKMDVFKYVDKTKRSTIVFNTTAVHDCHGWKLGEYLAMGKAIISTQLSNYFPVFDNVGLPMHIITDMSSFESDIKFLIEDAKYRNELMKKSSLFYENHARPIKIIENMVSHIKA